MEPTFYLAKNKQKLGPFSQRQLSDMVRTGNLKPTDMVLCSGTDKWVHASTISNVFGKLEDSTKPVGLGRSNIALAHEPPVVSPQKSGTDSTPWRRMVRGQWPWLGGVGVVVVFMIGVGIWLISGGNQRSPTPGSSEPAPLVMAPSPSVNPPPRIQAKDEPEPSERIGQSPAKEPVGVKIPALPPVAKALDGPGPVVRKPEVSLNGIGSPSEREKLLAQWQKKNEETLRVLQESHQKHNLRMDALRKEEASLRQNPRFGDPFNKEVMSRFTKLLKEQQALQSDLQISQNRIAKAGAASELERRKIVMQFPLAGDPTYTQYKGFLYTQPELEQYHAYEKEHLTPRAVADDYLRAASKKGLVRQPVFAGLFRNPKSSEMLAVAYTVSSVNGRQVLGNTVHVFVYQDNWQFWQVWQVAADGVDILLGAPPTGYVKAAE